MTTYQIEFASRGIIKELNILPAEPRSKIQQTLPLLANFPNLANCQKLMGYNSLYRLRVGVYRIIFEVFPAKQLIVILLIKHRKDIYRRLQDM